MSVSITELIWQAKHRGQTIQGNLFVPIFFYGIPLLLGTWLQSTGCQHSLEICLFLSFEKLRSSAVLCKCHSEGP